MNTQQRLIVIVAIMASFVSFLDGSVVNVALPAITRELHGGLSLQQWVVDAYLVTLGSLILIAGSLSDIFGRKRILNIGLLGFLVTSLLCAAAPNGPFLIVARALQGIAGALLVPSSLALIMSAFKGEEQGKAVGTWTAWTGIAFIIGPLLGGLLVDTLSWRYIFAINVIPVALTVFLLRKIHESRHDAAEAHIDVLGAVLCAAAFGLLGYGLIEQSHYGWRSPLIFCSLLLGAASLTVFVFYEARTKYPMLPLGLFKIRNFWTGNVATAAIYGGLSIATFIIAVFVQQVGGYSALAAGMALVPVTGIMFFLSPRFGALAGKYGARIFMTVGPLLCAAGFLWMLRTGSSVHYWIDLLPGVILFGVGLSVTVAPLTSAILGSVEPGHAGIASAVNNAVSRIAGLVTVAAIGVVVGTTLTAEGFHKALIATALLMVVGGVVSWAGIRSSRPV
jgi:EmrB/QacA subfamily drug resistance transporter